MLENTSDPEVNHLRNTPAFTAPGNDPAKPMHIVIGVDTSAHTLAAARFVRDLLPPAGSRVTALGTLNPNQSHPHPRVLKALNKVTAILENSGIEVKTDLLHGHKIEQLVLFTQQHPADLLIIGANGLRPHFGIFKDGTPQQLVETAHCPVLVARASYTQLRHVLLAVDFTWSSRRAIRYLEPFHLPAQAKISVIHVKPPESELEDEPPATASDSEPKPAPVQRRTPAFWGLLPSALQTSVTPSTNGHGVLHYATEVLRAAGINTQGDAATTISNYARRHHVDLVIAGSRTISQMASWITEDITRKLIYNAGCAVLIAKEGMGDQAPALHEGEILRSGLRR